MTRAVLLLGKQAFSANWDDWDDISAAWDDIIPVTPCHWDDIWDDGGSLPHGDEALDQSIGINAVYLTTYLIIEQ